MSKAVQCFLWESLPMPWTPGQVDYSLEMEDFRKKHLSGTTESEATLPFTHPRWWGVWKRRSRKRVSAMFGRKLFNELFSSSFLWLRQAGPDQSERQTVGARRHTRQGCVGWNSALRSGPKIGTQCGSLQTKRTFLMRWESWGYENGGLIKDNFSGCPAKEMSSFFTQLPSLLSYGTQGVRVSCIVGRLNLFVLRLPWGMSLSFLMSVWLSWAIQGWWFCGLNLWWWCIVEPSLMLIRTILFWQWTATQMPLFAA